MDIIEYHNFRQLTSDQPLALARYEQCEFHDSQWPGGDWTELQFLECTFTNCDLSLLHLNQCAFRELTFRDCKMLGLHFEDLHEFGFSARFEHCQLDNCTFTGVPLRSCAFQDCRLRDADFTEADLQGATLSGCDLAQAQFDRSNLRQCDLRGSYDFRIDPEQNQIRKAQFSRSSLAGLLQPYELRIED